MHAHLPLLDSYTVNNQYAAQKWSQIGSNLQLGGRAVGTKKEGSQSFGCDFEAITIYGCKLGVEVRRVRPRPILIKCNDWQIGA